MSLRRATLALLAIAAFIALWAFVIELNRLVVTRAEITVDRLPAAFDGLRITAISDLHAGSRFTGESKLHRVVSLANQQNSDMVILLGDFVAGNYSKPTTFPTALLTETLGKLHAPLGVYAVLGNHDYWSGAPPIADALRAGGIHMIDNAVVPIERRGARIWLLGIPDRWTRHRSDFRGDITPEMAAGLVVGLTHNPDVFPELTPPVPLVFAGHTHGGQVRIPFLGRPIMPSEFGERYAAGLVREQGRQIYVTTGVGTSIFPVRFLVPPEIAVLTLRRPDSASGTIGTPEAPAAR